MQTYQRDFIDHALERQVLRFGRFTLKSGRISPYFFNAGQFNTGISLAMVGRCYASAIEGAGVEFDMLFGPAYKGIPLAVTTAMAIAERCGRDVPCAFNRKETKAHGEGGNIIGAPLRGRVLIIDDVITAGTAVREVVALIRAAGATVAGVALGLDRGERGVGSASAVAEMSAELAAPVFSIIHLDDIIRYLEDSAALRASLAGVVAYRTEWGVSREYAPKPQ